MIVKPISVILIYDILPIESSIYFLGGDKIIIHNIEYTQCILWI